MLNRRVLGALSGAMLLPVLLPVSARATTSSAELTMLRQKTLAASTFATSSSQLAEAQGEHRLVKGFARFEIAEQAAVLRSLQLAGMTLPASVTLEAEQAQLLQQLQGLRGAEFDRMYVQGQLTGHRELMRLHQALLTAGSQEEQIIATLALASIEQHTAMLEAMQQHHRG